MVEICKMSSKKEITRRRDGGCGCTSSHSSQCLLGITNGVVDCVVFLHLQWWLLNVMKSGTTHYCLLLVCFSKKKKKFKSTTPQNMSLEVSTPHRIDESTPQVEQFPEEQVKRARTEHQDETQQSQQKQQQQQQQQHSSACSPECDGDGDSDGNGNGNGDGCSIVKCEQLDEDCTERQLEELMNDEEVKKYAENAKQKQTNSGALALNDVVDSLKHVCLMFILNFHS